MFVRMGWTLKDLYCAERSNLTIICRRCGLVAFSMRAHYGWNFQISFKNYEVLNQWITIKYCKVASRSMRYCSGNQKFCILKSLLLTCRIFFLGTKLFKIESWNFQHLIDLRFREPSQNFSWFGQLLLILDWFLGMLLIEFKFKFN